MNIGLFESVPKLDNTEPLNNVTLSVRDSIKRKEASETSALLELDEKPKSYSQNSLDDKDKLQSEQSINVSRDDIVLRIPINESDLDEEIEDEQKDDSKPNNSSNV